jgi:hypothetical protein
MRDLGSMILMPDCVERLWDSKDIYVNASEGMVSAT